MDADREKGVQTPYFLVRNETERIPLRSEAHQAFGSIVEGAQASVDAERSSLCGGRERTSGRGRRSRRSRRDGTGSSGRRGANDGRGAFSRTGVFRVGGEGRRGGRRRAGSTPSAGSRGGRVGAPPVERRDRRHRDRGGRRGRPIDGAREHERDGARGRNGECAAEDRPANVSRAHHLVRRVMMRPGTAPARESYFYSTLQVTQSRGSILRLGAPRSKTTPTPPRSRPPRPSRGATASTGRSTPPPRASARARRATAPPCTWSRTTRGRRRAPRT